jgi:hypothetical protein
LDGREHGRISTHRSVHEVAQAGFAEAAGYERARPGYPAEALDWLAEHLRLGAGPVSPSP